MTQEEGFIECHTSNLTLTVNWDINPLTVFFDSGCHVSGHTFGEGQHAILQPVGGCGVCCVALGSEQVTRCTSERLPEDSAGYQW